MKNLEVEKLLNELIERINAGGKEYISNKYINDKATLLFYKFGGRCLLWHIDGHDVQYVQLPDGTVITQDEDNERVPIFSYDLWDYRESCKNYNNKLKEVKQ